jgi:acyl-CoA synthetase (AMP-forming)/AMP-acid ligase II
VSSLCDLLREPRDPASPVARYWDPTSRTDRSHRWGDFLGHVAALQERLRAELEGAWVLLTESAYAFAVGLFSLWCSGRHAVSPPNEGPGTLGALRARVAGAISDRRDWFSEGVCLAPISSPSSGAPFVPERLDRDSTALELFTSGTTGAEKPVVKRIRHLDDEVQQLARSWDGGLGGAMVFATASHQHLYGLLFGVLWPLCRGRAFQADHFLHAGELVPRMRESGAWALASVPAHLKRLAHHDHLGAARAGCRAVFSSGGPLPADTAHRVAEVLGRAPLEVLGSTETGGVAWRRQELGQPESAWTPMPGVSITRDPDSGVARVRSAFVSLDEDGQGFAMGDRIALEDGGCFRLEGRSDRVVKVGERRLDLVQMESQLRGHALLADAALVVVERDGEPRVAAAVVPTEAGWALLREEGRRGFGRSLAAGLAADWHPVLHPRLLRTLSRLPENPQGKVTADALRALFREPERSAVDRPQVLEELRGSDEIERVCRVPSELSCFAGHFPDAPVVPGVLQLDWAMELAGELMDTAPAAEAIESVKFRAPLGPGALFRIRVCVARGRVDFRLWGESTEHTAGLVRLATARSGS